MEFAIIAFGVLGVGFLLLSILEYDDEWRKNQFKWALILLSIAGFLLFLKNN